MNRKMSETFSIMLVVSFGSVFGSGRPFKSDHFTSYTSLVWRIETDDFHHGPVMKLIIIFEVFTKKYHYSATVVAAANLFCRGHHRELKWKDGLMRWTYAM